MSSVWKNILAALGARVVWHSSETAEIITAYETRIGCALPATLREFYVTQGTFSVQSDTGIECLAVLPLSRILAQLKRCMRGRLAAVGFVQQIGDLNGGSRAFERSLMPPEADEIPNAADYLNSHYFLFAYALHPDRRGADYLYFTRTGHIGTYRYGNSISYQDTLIPMLPKRLSCYLEDSYDWPEEEDVDDYDTLRPQGPLNFQSLEDALHAIIASALGAKD